MYADVLSGPFSVSEPHARTWASSAAISPDHLLVHGGCLSGGMSGGPCPSGDSWLYTRSRNRWQRVDASCIGARQRGAMASLVSDGYRHAAVMFAGLHTDKTVLYV